MQKVVGSNPISRFRKRRKFEVFVLGRQDPLPRPETLDPPVVPCEPAPPTSQPDPERFAQVAPSYGIEIVGPGQALD
jgi:hypothetical protein